MSPWENCSGFREKISCVAENSASARAWLLGIEGIVGLHLLRVAGLIYSGSFDMAESFDCRVDDLSDGWSIAESASLCRLTAAELTAKER